MSVMRSRSPDVTTRIPGRFPYRIRGWKEPWGIELEVYDVAACHAHRLRMRLPLRGVTPRWSLARGLPRGASRADVFERFLNRIHRVRREAIYDVLEREGWRGAAREDMAQTMRGVYGVVREFAIHAAQCLDDALRHVALRFPSCARVWIYGRLARDETRRLAQAAEVCPGLMLFLFALAERRRFRSIVPEVEQVILGGERLPIAIRTAVEGWAEAAKHAFLADPGAYPGHRFLGRAPEPEVLEDLLRRQALLVRRAGPLVPPTLLFTPPPLAFAPDDIPKPTYANARWFRVMKARAWMFEDGTVFEHARRRQFVHAISRHAATLEARLPPTLPVPRQLEITLQHLIRTRRVARRGMNVVPLVQEALQWHAGAYPRRPARRTPRPEPRPDDAVLPEPPFALRAFGPESWLEPIRTVGQLRDEGSEMEHCAASYEERAVAGESIFYRGFVEQMRVTVELREVSPGNFVICEARGRRNLRIDETRMADLARWLAEAVEAMRAEVKEADGAAEPAAPTAHEDQLLMPWGDPAEEDAQEP